MSASAVRRSNEVESPGDGGLARRLLPGVALLAHAWIASRLPVTAWPEVTTPAYLISRNWGLYREIKFVHTPGLMEALGLWFRAFGVSASSVRAFAMIWPLAAHATLLHQTRKQPAGVRLAASAFFLATFYSWNGSAVWPTVVVAVLAIPIAGALGARRFALAGLLIGVAIVIKQTAAYLLVLVAISVFLTRMLRDAAKVALMGAVPFLLTGLAFLVTGSGRYFVEWTCLVPFRNLYGSINIAPTGPLLFPILVAFLPLVLAATLAVPGEEPIAARWHLLVAVGLTLMVYPRFGALQAVAATPCLAVGAAKALARPGRLLRPAVVALVLTITASTGAIPLLGESWDRSVVFWNDSPALNAVVRRLKAYPHDARLVADIWENLLPRSGRLPPGRLYVHPWLSYFDEVDGIRARTEQAAAQRGTISVAFRRAASTGVIVGPYSVTVR